MFSTDSINLFYQTRDPIYMALMYTRYFMVLIQHDFIIMRMKYPTQVFNVSLPHRTHECDTMRIDILQ